MGLLSIVVTFLVDTATLAGNVLNPFTYASDSSLQVPLPFSNDAQVPIASPESAGQGISFHPVGSSPGFKCTYPTLNAKKYKACNDRKSRDCWVKGEDRRWDVTTDYENPSLVPVGQTREYHLTISNTTIHPLGLPKRALLYNATYPGPLLEACWGDQLLIHVTNTLPDQGTTIHWHGIRQLNTNQMDGVALTQCPIPGLQPDGSPGTFTYNFTALQYGTTWYHSHYSLQYADGLAGPLVIYGPTSADYDVEVPPVLISDWLHAPASDAYLVEEAGAAAAADAIVVNGKGHNPSTLEGSYSVTRLTRGKKHKLRLINGSAGTSFVFSIDNHTLTIVTTDFVPVRPYTVDSLVIGIGQRYTVIVNGLDEPGKGHFWMRTQPAWGCNTFTDPTNASAPFVNFANGTADPFDTRTAIVSYHDPSSVVTLPDCSSHTMTPNGTDLTCLDVDGKNLVPIMRWDVDPTPLNSVNLSTFETAHQNENDTTLGRAGRYAHWELRLPKAVEEETGVRKHHPFWVDFGNPSLLNISGVERDPNYNVIDYDFAGQKDGFIYMVIDGTELLTPAGPGLENTSVPKVVHPIHWHGSDIVLLKQSTAPYNISTSIHTDNWLFDNPPRRDVALLPAGGYLAVAFKPDNPGAWLVHCHIAWHASAGLALQMIVQPGEVEGAVGSKAITDAQSLCRKWDAAEKTYPGKVDSGI